MRASFRLRWSVLLFALLSCGTPPVDPDDAGLDPIEDAGTRPEADGGQTPDAGDENDAGTQPEDPDTAITSGPTGVVAVKDATFTFTSPDAAATFECSLNYATYSACASPLLLEGLSEGPQFFRVRATYAGGFDKTPASASWLIDTTPPETTITSGPYSAVRASTASFAFTSSEPNSTFECAFDGAAFSPCTSPVSYSALSNGQHTFEVRATDALGNLDPTPASRSWTIDPAATTRVRIVASNLTSGNLQSYDPGHGARILDGLNPDIVLIQEFNYGDNSTATLDAFVQTHFGPGFVWSREPGGKQIPNGVISRFPIIASGAWDDPQVGNREFAWARIDLPGPVDLWAVSVHLLTTSSSVRQSEATALRQAISANVPEADYLVVGGDFNTDSRSEACVSTLGQVVVAQSPWPVDQSGNGGTNASRTKPYDWVLVDSDLSAHKVAVQVGANSFSSGLVFDSREYAPLSDVSPVLAGDSGAPNMQHMAVVRDFVVPN